VRDLAVARKDHAAVTSYGSSVNFIPRFEKREE
jgi:hypothetical protein